MIFIKYVILKFLGKVTCKHCSKLIYKYNSIWYHKNGSPYCSISDSANWEKAVPY